MAELIVGLSWRPATLSAVRLRKVQHPSPASSDTEDANLNYYAMDGDTKVFGTLTPDRVAFALDCHPLQPRVLVSHRIYDKECRSLHIIHSWYCDAKQLLCFQQQACAGNTMLQWRYILSTVTYPLSWFFTRGSCVLHSEYAVLVASLQKRLFPESHVSLEFKTDELFSAQFDILHNRADGLMSPFQAYAPPVGGFGPSGRLFGGTFQPLPNPPSIGPYYSFLSFSSYETVQTLIVEYERTTINDALSLHARQVSGVWKALFGPGNIATLTHTDIIDKFPTAYTFIPEFDYVQDDFGI